MTEFRVMPPSSAAIWLADRPSAQSFFRSSTRSSVHMTSFLFAQKGEGLDRIRPRRRTAWDEPVQRIRLTHKLREQSAARDVVAVLQTAYYMPRLTRKSRAGCVHIFPPSAGDSV